MNRVPIPELDSDLRKILTECIDDYEKEGLKKQLKSHIDEAETASKDYEKCIPDGISDYFKNYYMKRLNLEMTNFKKIYEEKIAKVGKPGQKYYNQLLNKVTLCPICGSESTNSLDHYLPKSKYPLLIATVANLVPECFECNYNKRSYTTNEYEKTLFHPYYDEINYKWLDARIQFVDKEFMIVFYNSHDLMPMKSRLDITMEKYQLNIKYRGKAITEINSIKWMYAKKVYKGLSMNEIKSAVEESRESAEAYDANAWQAALYRALEANCEEFVNWCFRCCYSK